MRRSCVLLALGLALLGCTTVREHHFRLLERRPDEPVWRSFFPEKMFLTNWETAADAPDTFGFWTAWVHDRSRFWAGNDGGPRVVSYRLRYLLTTPAGDGVAERIVDYGGPRRTDEEAARRPTVLLAVPEDLDEVVLEARFERLLEGDSTAVDRVLRGRFRRENRERRVLHYK
jgi:hypothetical protein